MSAKWVPITVSVLPSYRDRQIGALFSISRGRFPGPGGKRFWVVKLATGFEGDSHLKGTQTESLHVFLSK